MGKLVLLIIISGIFYFFSYNLSPNINNSSTTQEFGLHQNTDLTSVEHHIIKNTPAQNYDSIFSVNQPFEAKGFDFPVGKPNALNYFNAQTFGENFHLGEDWNGKGGGNTDLGDPVYSVANGLVTFTENVCCGWGNIVRIIHKLPNDAEYSYVESLYAHMHNINVKNGELVKRGQQIGTIGTAHGRYSAHLHFEMRNALNMSIGKGYSEDQTGYFAPTDFIEKNRPSK